MRGTEKPAAAAKPCALSARISARSTALTRSSASRHNTQSWRAASTANCFCERKPGQSRSMIRAPRAAASSRDRKSTRLNSSHLVISYAVFCLKKKILADFKVQAHYDHTVELVTVIYVTLYLAQRG